MTLRFRAPLVAFTLLASCGSASAPPDEGAPSAPTSAGFARAGAWLVSADERSTVRLPVRSAAPFEVADARGITVGVELVGSRTVDASVEGGAVVYRGAHPAGGDVIHRAVPGGTEDFVSFAARPAEEALDYVVRLDARVAGLRLVADAFELLDANGTPLLRMAPPFVVDAAGEKHAAHARLDGCAFDTDPRAPWGRPVTAPGARTCRLQIAWSGISYPAVVDPSWTTTIGAMVFGREMFEATVLLDGRVLVIGGYSNGSWTTAAELYDPSTDTWSPTGSTTFVHAAAGAVTLPDGRALVVGGNTGSSENGETEIYDTTMGTFTTSFPLSMARCYHTVTLLDDGRVLVAAGSNRTMNVAADIVEIFDPANPAPWQEAGTVTTTFGATATKLQDGRVLLVGGKTTANTPLATVQVFDPVSSTWTTTAGLKVARGQHTATLLDDGRVLVAGGHDVGPLAKVELFDPVAATWTAGPDLLTARLNAEAAPLPGGRVVVVSGEGPGSYVGDAEIFDPVLGWSSSTLATQHARAMALPLFDGSILVPSGTGPAGDTTIAERMPRVFCADDSQCPSGSCLDSVCCDVPCAGVTACVTCSAAKGATADGTCTMLDGTSCTTMNVCEDNATCNAGACVGQPKTCTAPNDCSTADPCDPDLGGCAFHPKLDGSPCAGGTCFAGSCVLDPDTTGSGNATAASGATSGTTGSGSSISGGDSGAGGASAGGGSGGSSSSSRQSGGCTVAGGASDSGGILTIALAVAGAAHRRRKARRS